MAREGLDSPIGETDEPDSEMAAADEEDAAGPSKGADFAVCRFRRGVYSVGSRICYEHIVWVCGNDGRWHGTRPPEHC